MRGALILCDYASQDIPGGKLHMIGGGWSVTAPSPGPRAVAVFIKVGWTEANQPHKFSVSMVDADGHVVAAQGPAGAQRIEFQGNLEVGRPAGIPEGSEIDAQFAINLAQLPLVPGQRYTWRLEIDGDEAAAESFYVARPPGMTRPDGEHRSDQDDSD
jgi:hypothetical protein